MKKSGLSIMEKIMYPLGGFLIGILIIATGLKITGAFWGAFLGIIINGGFSWFLIKKYPAQKDKKYIYYGIISSIIFIALAGIGIWIFANILMAGISG